MLKTISIAFVVSVFSLVLAAVVYGQTSSPTVSPSPTNTASPTKSPTPTGTVQGAETTLPGGAPKTGRGL